MLTCGEKEIFQEIQELGKLNTEEWKIGGNTRTITLPLESFHKKGLRYCGGCYLRNNFISEQTIYHSESEICNNISREDSIICQLVWLNWFCTKIGNPGNQ